MSNVLNIKHHYIYIFGVLELEIRALKNKKCFKGVYNVKSLK